MNNTYYIGSIKEILEYNVIRFEIPYIMNNEFQYPIAYPLGYLQSSLTVNQTILVIDINPEIHHYFYQILNSEGFLGIKLDDSNYIEFTDSEVILQAGTSLTIKLGDTEVIKVTSSGIEILADSTDTINPILNKAFTCATCYMTGAPHGTNTRSLT